MNIYQIDRAIEECVDLETGEILDIERLEQLQMDRVEKLENVACWIKNLVAENAAIRAEEIALAERRRKGESKVESLKRYLSDALGGQKFSTARCSVTFRKTPAKCELHEPALAIAWAYANGHSDLVTIKAPDISKTGLLALLKAGENIPGAEMVSGVSMGVK